MSSNKLARILLPSLLLATHFHACAQAAPEPKETAVLDALPEHLLYLYTKSPTAVSGATLNQLAAGSRRWEVGRSLRVCFFSGNKTLTTLIREVASEWNAYSSTKFDFGPAGSWYRCTTPNANYEIRVGFDSKGYWSAIGTDAEATVDSMAPTMNFEMFNIRYSQSRPAETVVAEAVPYHKAAIRHEFGHALGLLHEIANPALNCYAEIIWNGPGNAYEYFLRTQNWDAEKVLRNLGHVSQTDPDYVAGDGDLDSNMLYSLPPEILKNGTGSKCYHAQNLVISKKDAEFIAKIYPPAGTQSILAEAETRKANIKAIPSTLTEAALEDIQIRTLSDLESNDAFIRRNARAKLSELVAKTPPGKFVADLVKRAPKESYRYQLGVAVALSNTPEKVPVDASTLESLKSQQSEAKDKTLKDQLKTAEGKLRIEQ